MNTSTNVTLQVLGTGLVAAGVTTFTSNWVAGAVEIALGIIAYIVYEFVPTKQ